MADLEIGIKKFIPVFQEYAKIYLCLKKKPLHNKTPKFWMQPCRNCTVNNEEKFDRVIVGFSE